MGKNLYYSMIKNLCKALGVEIKKFVILRYWKKIIFHFPNDQKYFSTKKCWKRK